MSDIYTAKRRSQIMSGIRSRGNKSTEIKMLKMLKQERIHGWRRHLNLPGRPDFAWRDNKLALFVDGCFWHGCKKCYTKPRGNAEYWADKIKRNVKRDRQLREKMSG